MQTGEGALRQASPRRQRVETWLAEGAAPLTPQQYRARALAELAHSASFRDLQQRASARAGAGGAARLAAHRSNYMPPLPAEPDQARAGEPAGSGLLPRAVSAPHALMRPPAAPAPLESTAEEPAGDRWADDSGAASAEGAGESEGSERGEAGWLCRSWPWRALCAAGAAAEWPLLMLRRVSIPALAPDCYDRRWLVAALAGGPVFAAWCALDSLRSRLPRRSSLRACKSRMVGQVCALPLPRHTLQYPHSCQCIWFATCLRLFTKRRLTCLALGRYLRAPLVWAAAGAGAGAAAATAAAWSLRGAPPDAPPPTWRLGTRWPLGTAVVSGLGFVLAAMWVDTVASELVGLIALFGSLSGLDHAVLGLTVLAWGNSIGDLSTNLAMARRGLANMAMTACYAGPLFNLLVGLGLGFLRARRSAGAPLATRLSPGAAVSAGFAAAMCASVLAVGVAARGRLPARFGWALIALYATFLVASVARLLLLH